LPPTKALRPGILAVSFYGWRIEGSSPAWRATEDGPITVLRRRCRSDDGRPARGGGPPASPVLLGAWLNGRTQNVREMIPRRGDGAHRARIEGRANHAKTPFDSKVQFAVDERRRGGETGEALQKLHDFSPCTQPDRRRKNVRRWMGMCCVSAPRHSKIRREGYRKAGTEV
jgi:hypothetical protein